MGAPLSHRDYEELAAGYALGALEPDDEEAFQRHLATCGACQADLRALEGVAARLAYATDPADPPASLLGSVRAGTGTPRPAVTARLRELLAWLPAGRVGGAALAVALLTVALWALALRDREVAQRERLATLEAAARMLNDPAARPVPLTGPAGRATVLASSLRDEGVLVATDLPRPAQGRIYQLWGISPGREPARGPTFPGGEPVQVVRFQLPVQPGMAFTVTVEPPGGSDRPSGRPVLEGAAPAPH